MGLANHLFEQKTPLEAAATNVRKLSGTVEGDRLMRDRRHARARTAEEEIAANDAAEAAARAAHDAGEHDEPFDGSGYDAVRKKWTDELRSRIEIAARQDEVYAASRAALDEATVTLAEITFNERLLPKMRAALLALHEVNQEVIKAEANLPSKPDFAIRFLTEELVHSWLHWEQLRCNPPPRPEPPQDSLVWFTQPWSDGFRQYNPSEGASFPVETCIEIMASGAGEIVNPSPATLRRVEEARQKLAQQKPSYEGSAREDVGWVTPDAQ